MASKSQREKRNAGKLNELFTIEADVEILAAKDDDDKMKGGAPSFNVLAYTGGKIEVAAFDLPIVVDLGGMQFGKSLVANLDHDSRQRVGHVTERSKSNGQLTLAGVASAATSARDEVVNSAAQGFVWQASIEAKPLKVVELASGKNATVNGQQVTGPAYIVRQSQLKGFSFVSHGADDNTTVSIAATAADDFSQENEPMKTEFKKWILAAGFDADNLSDDQQSWLRSRYDAEIEAAEKAKPKSNEAKSIEELVEKEKAKRERVTKITDIMAGAIRENPQSIESIEAMGRLAVENDWSVEKFELEMLRATRPSAGMFVTRNREGRIGQRVIEAAVCMSGGMQNLEKHFDDQTLEAADKKFRHGIGLKQLFIMAARENGYGDNYGGEVTLETQRAAFGMGRFPEIKASGFSTFSLPDILSNTANKFLMEGWMSVDNTWSRVSARRSVRDFKQVSTLSLTGALEYEKVGPDGELKHGEVGERKYTNQADTYGRIFAITRTDIINDDLGALTAVPRRLGRGGALKLNDVFWTIFLNNSSFFTAGNNNVSTGAGSALGLTGLKNAEIKFMNQTDPDGKPLGVMPAILLVPPTLKATAMELNSSQLIVTGNTTAQPNANIWAGRFTVESAPYMENSAYTGNSAAAWYLLANPSDMAVIEVAALNGRVEPTVESADADFNVLGVQMRGYADFGVALQEPRGGVRSAGS